MKITREDLGLKVHTDKNGQVFVIDLGKGVKSPHPSVMEAEMFITGLLAMYNPNQLN